MKVETLDLFPIKIFRTKVEDNKNLKEILVGDILKNVDSLVTPEHWITKKLITSFNGEPDGMEVIKKNKELLNETYQRCIKNIFDNGSSKLISPSATLNALKIALPQNVL